MSVYSVSVYPSSTTIKTGNWYYGAYAIVNASSNCCTDVEWYSDSPSVASVNKSYGYIYGISPGTAKIYAISTVDSSKKDYITVKVTSGTICVDSVTLNRSSISLENGDKFTLSATVCPTNASNKSISWSSTNPSVATVSGGVVTAKARGWTYIFAEAQDGSGEYDSCYVNVTEDILVTSVTISPSSKTMNIGNSAYLYETVCPTNATNKCVKWSSNKTSVATVNPDTGLVIARGAGTATITAAAQDGSGKKGYCTITVKAPIRVTGVEVCPTSLTMNVGDIEYLCASITPYNATNQTITWCSSNENVATVGLYTGKITAKMAGTTTITATTADGGFQACCVLEVCKLKIYQTKNTFKFDENGCLAEDLGYNDISISDFDEIKNIDWSDYDFEDATKLRDDWESLCKLTSTQPLQDVVLDMVEHFMAGTGEDFSNDTLTSKVQNHESTEEYVEAVKTKLNEVLKTYNGDISTFKYDVDERENNPFIQKLKGTNQPVFNKISDYVNGLVVCLHGIWGNQIEVKSYTKNGNTYSGVLTFTLYDHFGLDEEDVVKFEEKHKGFGSWYILQHSKTFSGEYKPFVTVMEFDVEFSGTL